MNPRHTPSKELIPPLPRRRKNDEAWSAHFVREQSEQKAEIIIPNKQTRRRERERAKQRYISREGKNSGGEVLEESPRAPLGDSVPK